MRSLRAVATVLGLALTLVTSCEKQDTGLLDLTLNADATNPPPQGVAIALTGSGGIQRSYPGKFPPDGAASLRLEYPDLPTGTITFTVQTLDSKGCVVGESPAPFPVAIKAGAKVTASTTIVKSTKPCGDGGGPSPGLDGGFDSARASEDGSFDVASAHADSPADNPVDVAAGIDVVARADDAPGIDVPANDARSVDGPVSDVPSDMPVPSVDSSSPLDALADSLPAVDTSASSPDIPTVPVIVSFIASPSTISAGSSTTLTAIFKNATGSSVDHGIGSVTSGNGVGTGALTTTTTYKLTVIDAAGISATQTVTVTIVPLPSITGFTTLLPIIAVGTLTQLTGTFSGGTGVIDQGIGAVTSGMTVPTGVLTTSKAFTLTVTNPAGDSVTKQATVSVSAAVGTGVFSATGSMTVARSSHTATLLPNGKVLIVGGSGDTSAELYDPVSGKFVPTGALGAARICHSATLLLNGKVLIVGGSGGLESAELYDSASGLFVPAGNLVQARECHAATLLLDGRVLVAGGDDPGHFGSAEIYDPAKGIFTATGQMSNPRTYTTADLLPDGKVLVAGGMNNTNILPRGLVATSDVWEPNTGLFTPTGPLFYGRASHTSVSLLNGNVLVVGGEGDGGPTLYSELYDPTKGAFSVSGILSEERYRHTTTRLSDGSVLVAGGIASSGSLAPALMSAETYDPDSGKFATINAMTTPRQLHTATLLPNGNVLLTGSLPNTASAELYW